MWDFDSLLQRLDSLNEYERLEVIIEELLEYNNVQFQTVTPVFTGTIESVNPFALILSHIGSIDGQPLPANPYADALTIAAANSGSMTQKDVGAPVIFLMRCGNMDSAASFLIASCVRTFSELGLPENADPAQCQAAVLKHPVFREAFHGNVPEGDDADTLFGEKQAALRELSEQLVTIQEQYRNDLAKAQTAKTLADQAAQLKEEIAQIAPGGLESVHAALQKYSEIEPELKRWNAIVKRYSGRSEDEPLHHGVQLSFEKGGAFADFGLRMDFRYAKSKVIPFLMALGTNQIITLFGAPGTGKTTFVRQMAKALGAKCSIISVQNNWTDTSDLLGYYSPIDKTYESTDFTEALVAANRDWLQFQEQSPLHIICLDEMNLARVEYYFATFLSLLQLEAEEQTLSLLPKHIQRSILEMMRCENADDPALKKLVDYVNLAIFPNIRFVGTMNSDDTTQMLSPKVVDRCFFIEMTNEDYSEENPHSIPDGYYPVSLFRAGQRDFPESSGAFASENGRFKKYAAQMWDIYEKTFRSDSSPNDFAEYLIIGKVLPALKKASAYQYPQAAYPKAYQAFQSRVHGDSYDYLGGNG